MNPALMMLLRGPAVAASSLLEFVAAYSSTSDATVVTFTGASLGEAAETRQIVVAVTSGSAAGGYVSAVTIGGITATLDQVAPSNVGGAALARATVPTGTTGNIVVTFTGGVARSTIAVYRSGVALTAAAATVTGAGADVALASASIVNPSGGTVIAAAHTQVTVPSWSGATEDHRTQVETVWGTSAHTTTVGSLTITPAATGSGQDSLAAVAYTTA